MATVKEKGDLFLKSLIEWYHPGRGEELLSCWAEKESAERIYALPKPRGEPKLLIAAPEALLSTLHYSWIAEGVKKLPKTLVVPAVASLQNPNRERLVRLFHLEARPLFTPSKIVRDFALQKLYENIEGAREALPLPFLPDYPLTPLLQLDMGMLLELFDLLGLHDLANKVRYIVDKKMLTKIYESLTPLRKKILQLLLQQQERVKLPPIALHKWNGEPEQLRKMLHRRGLLRFSSAIAGYDSAFLWHLSRHLDTGRGKILLRNHQPESTPLSSLFTEQVQKLLNIITKKRIA